MGTNQDFNAANSPEFTGTNIADACIVNGGTLHVECRYHPNTIHFSLVANEVHSV